MIPPRQPGAKPGQPAAPEIEGGPGLQAQPAQGQTQPGRPQAVAEEMRATGQLRQRGQGATQQQQDPEAAAPPQPDQGRERERAQAMARGEAMAGSAVAAPPVPMRDPGRRPAELGQAPRTAALAVGLEQRAEQQQAQADEQGPPALAPRRPAGDRRAAPGVDQQQAPEQGPEPAQALVQQAARPEGVAGGKAAGVAEQPAQGQVQAAELPGQHEEQAGGQRGQRPSGLAHRGAAQPASRSQSGA